ALGTQSPIRVGTLATCSRARAGGLVRDPWLASRRLTAEEPIKKTHGERPPCQHVQAFVQLARSQDRGGSALAGLILSVRPKLPTDKLLDPERRPVLLRRSVAGNAQGRRRPPRTIELGIVQGILIPPSSWEHFRGGKPTLEPADEDVRAHVYSANRGPGPPQ